MKKPKTRAIKTASNDLSINGTPISIDLENLKFSLPGSRIIISKNPTSYSLEVNLADRLNQHELTEARKSPALIFDLIPVSAEGFPLDFETITSIDLITLETSIGLFQIIFQDENTILMQLPSMRECGVRFACYAKNSVEYGSWGRINSLVDFSYHIDPPPAKHTHAIKREICRVEIGIEPTDNPILCFKIPEDPSSQSEPFSFKNAQASTRKKWACWFDNIPDIDPKYTRSYNLAWMILGNNLVSPRGNITRPSIMPSKSKYIGLWLWDNAFHALALRHKDTKLARDQIRVFLDHQLSNGMLPDAIYDQGIVTHIDHPIPGVVTKPPLLAWSAMKIHELDPDPGFLREIFPALEAWHSFWMLDTYEGLARYSHPYSFGLDNSPLWDSGMPALSPDINTYLYKQSTALSEMADILNYPSKSEKYRIIAQNLLDKMLEHFWNPDIGIFHTLINNQPITTITPVGFLPLWTGKLPISITNILVTNLTNPSILWTEFPLATVSISDDDYDPEDMWRGPMWLNMNYFLIEALESNGYDDLAFQLMEKTLNTVSAHDVMAEYYNPETGIPCPDSAKDFSWTAALFIDLVIKYTDKINSSRRKSL